MALGRNSFHTYNANGQKLTVTDARGFLAEMEYDGFGRQQRWIFPSKSTPGVADRNDYEQYLYDFDGNRTSLRKRDGRIVGYEYDALNRVVVKYMPAPSSSVRYAYDLRGLQTRAWYTANDWGVANAYDGFGRLVSTTTNMAAIFRTVSHKYDLEGRRTELTFPDGQKFWTARDGLGRAIENYQGPLGSTSTIMTAFYFDAASQLYRFGRRWGSATNYIHDSAGRLSRLEHGFGGAGGTGGTVSDFAYNPASQLRSETRTNDSYAWTASLATNRGYATNGQNQYTGTTTGATYDYDSNGNLSSTVNPPWSTSYVYDAENRLISASGSENATLVYDPLGRLFQISSNAMGVTQFLYDGDELIAEYNASGTLLRRYVHGDSDDDPLFWYEGAGLDQPRFPHTNHQGSVTGTAGPGGALLGINTYDEYGIRGANNTGRFQYTGQAWLPELGMYYYKARLYSPTLGRFLQTDPIGYDDQINLYAYVGNDPVNYVDPDGQQSEQVMDRRNQALLTAMRECDGGCLQMYAEAASIPLSLYGVTGLVRGAILGVGAFSLARRQGLAAASGLLRTAMTQKGNYGLGTATSQAAERLGRAFAGKGAKLSRNGKALISKDGKRVFRFAADKKGGSRQANFVTRQAVTKDDKFLRWTEVGNGHLTVRNAQAPTGTHIRQ